MSLQTLRYSLWGIAAVLAVACMLLTGCGGGGSEEETEITCGSYQHIGHTGLCEWNLEVR